MELAMQLLLPLLMLITVFAIQRMQDLFAAVVLFGIFSLFTVLLFVSLGAVDVALTEAVVGTGISLILFLGTLVCGRGGPPADWVPSARPRAGALALCGICAILRLYGSLDMPPFGDPGAPVNAYLSPLYLRGSAEDVGIPNVVTSILASYRGYDTLGELVVVFTAAVGVLLLLQRPAKAD